MFNIGDTGKDREGNDYRIICVDRKSYGFPIVALVAINGIESVCTFAASGHVYHMPGGQTAHRRDLLPPITKEFK